MANNTEDVELTPLDKWFNNYGIHATKGEQVDAVLSVMHLIQQDVNRQKLELLDRLELKIDDGNKSHSMAVIRSAIEAERKQLERSE